MNVFTLRELSSTLFYLHFLAKWTFWYRWNQQIFSLYFYVTYTYLSFLHTESQSHFVLSRSKFKVLLIIVWFHIVLSVWTNQRPENRVMTNVSVNSES